jgi:protein-ribulosamine 3-kinase
MLAAVSDSQFIEILGGLTAQNPVSCKATLCSGGDTHSSYRLQITTEHDGHQLLFAKVKELSRHQVLQSEYHSLIILNEKYGLCYPETRLIDHDDQHSFLILSYQDLKSLSEAGRTSESGKQLAELVFAQHQITADTFGWSANNYIGLSEQINQADSNWIRFYGSKRLLPQLELAQKNGLTANLVTQVSTLISNLSKYFIDYDPQPSLLHGDLWSGNVGIVGSTNKPMLFDPAPYFGDRESDIAFTELFGGFPQSFYDRYRELSPLHENYRLRRPIYNCYHALNHFNLFGNVYSDMVKQQLDEVIGV